MQISNIPFACAAAVAASVVLATGAHAQSTPTEQEIIDALLPPPASTQGLGRTRSMSDGRGVKVSGGVETPPSINLKVNFEFDSAHLDNESMLTLDVLGRALSSDALRGSSHRGGRPHGCEGHGGVQRRIVAAASRRGGELHRREIHRGQRPHLIEGYGRAPAPRQGQSGSGGQSACGDSERDAAPLVSRRVPLALGEGC